MKEAGRRPDVMIPGRPPFLLAARCCACVTVAGARTWASCAVPFEGGPRTYGTSFGVSWHNTNASVLAWNEEKIYYISCHCHTRSIWLDVRHVCLKGTKHERGRESCAVREPHLYLRAYVHARGRLQYLRTCVLGRARRRRYICARPAAYAAAVRGDTLASSRTDFSR